MNDPAFLPATDLLAALREKRISSRELLEHYLQRIDLHNRRLNAVLTLDAERARREADAADRALARGEDLGPLHGLPMTVKDAFETAGVRTTAGAAALAEHVPERDAEAVKRLRAAGAVIFGKTNVPALGADGQFYNPLFGSTNNPWDTERTTGGSSGGSAGALAGGLSALELGGDIAGSIRRPAHYTGVFGLKPSYGLVPSRGHIPGAPGIAPDADMNAIGPMARGVDDLELALETLAGPDDGAGDRLEPGAAAAARELARRLSRGRLVGRSLLPRGPRGAGGAPRRGGRARATLAWTWSSGRAPCRCSTPRACTASC